jgi:PAS domain S-box-containing protein
VERTRRALAAFAVAYAVCAVIAVAVAPTSPRVWRLLGDWIAAPVQVAAIVSTATVLWGRWTSRRTDLSMWALVFAFCVTSLIASFVWNVLRKLGGVPSLSFPDLLYFIDYGLLTAAYAVAFRRFGGSFRDARTWLDFMTIVVAVIATFWGTLLGTFLPPAHGPRVDLPYAISYAASVSVWMAFAALLFLRMPRFRPAMVLLICAGLIETIWEVGWLATWLTDRNYVGAFYNFGDVLAFTMIACAAALTAERSELEDKIDDTERSAYTFAPTLSALSAIALFGASLATTRAPDAWALVGLVILAVLLLVARQAAALKKLADLNRALAYRVADARLTELVRQSADAFLVIDSRGVVTFASAATEAMIGIASTQALGADAVALFGPDHEEAFDRFLKRLVADPDEALSLELSLERPDLSPRTLRLLGANRLANIHIGGLTLTMSDISEQRALERDVLTAANHERLRLAGDIHDGLGQELSGIALMLHGLSKSPDLDAVRPRTELNAIVGHVAQAIRGARDLARGLSPIYVVRGSLRDALQRLARDAGNTPPVQVEVDPLLGDLMIDELPADHLYRIAREAVKNAIRHSSCSRVEVRLRVLDETLWLEIADDGVGYDLAVGPDNGFGLRLMEYRARIIGATFEMVRRENGGTTVRAQVRLWTVARKSAVDQRQATSISGAADFG